MRKLLAGLTVLSFLVSAAPALARGWHMPSSDVEVEVENENTDVTNEVVVVASTGDNEISGGGGRRGGHGGGGFIMTGDATAVAEVLVDTNYTDIKVKAPCRGCRGDVEVEVENEDTDVGNEVKVIADTGDNEIGGGRRHHGGSGGGGFIMTGDAWAGAEVFVLTNHSIVRVRR